MNERNINPFSEKIWLKNYPERIPENLEYPNKPLYYILENAVQKYPNKTALVFFGTEITFKELDLLSSRFANFLQKAGIKKGDRISFLLPNSPQYVIAFWGILKAGACVNSMNPLYTERELQEMLSDSEARMIIVMDALYPRIKNIQSQTKIENVVITSIADYFPNLLKTIFRIKDLPRRIKQGKPQGKGIFYFKKIVEKINPKFSPVEIDTENDLAVLQYTGGTTGKPKGVMLTHKNIVADTVQLKYWFPMEEGKETFIGLVPFFHIGGVTASLTWGSLWAAKLVIIPRFNTKPVLKAITKYKATAFVGVPSIYIALDKMIKESPQKYSIESLKLAGVGMAPCPRNVIELFRKDFNKELLEGYGLTENSGVTFQNIPEKGSKIGSVGCPFPDTEVKIVNPETNREVGINEPGELCFRGPHVTSGYWKRESETNNVLKDGWFYSGDMAKIDENGFFYILGRKDDVIGVKGYQVYPQEIENVLQDTGLVSESAVVGIPDEYAGQKIVAYIILKKDKEIDIDTLKKHCEKNLAEFKVPSDFIIKDDLPRSPVRKILKYKLREETIGKSK